MVQGDRLLICGATCIFLVRIQIRVFACVTSWLVNGLENRRTLRSVVGSNPTAGVSRRFPNLVEGAAPRTQCRG